MEEPINTHSRKIGKTTYIIGLKPAEKAKGTLEDKLKKLIQRENLKTANDQEA